MKVDITPGTRIRLKKRKRKRKIKKLYRVLSVGLCMAVLGGIFSFTGYQTYDNHYRKDMMLAQVAMQHLQKAEVLITTLPQNPFDAPKIGQTQQEFGAALVALTPLQADLQLLPGSSTSLPIYGTRIGVAFHLVPLAIAASRAGITGCAMLNVLIARFQKPFSAQGKGLTQNDLKTAHLDLQQITSELSIVMSEANQLHLEDVQFDPRLVKFVAAIQKITPMLQEWLVSAEQFLTVAPIVLGIGSPTNYLIEVLDSTELRPEGGFIGNYGFATFSGGRLIDAHITDVDLLDRPFEAAGNKIPYPAAYSWFDLAPTWSLRDTGLDADFPTVARYSELNYKREGGTVPVQGVIAITPALIEHALAITGPITVSEYHETITAQNLIARIHYHQLGGAAAGEGSDRVASPDGYSSLRKRFTALLATHFLERVNQLPASTFPKLVQLLASAMKSKDIQLYLNLADAEALLQRYQLAATIQPSTKDSLFVVDANIAGNKANNLITTSMNDEVTLDEQGNAIHYTTLRYAWTTAGKLYGNSLYRDYARIYVPQGSLLQSQDGWQWRGTSPGFEHEVWSGFFTLLYGQTRTITLTWTVHYAAQNESNSWHYHYLIQRQAGTNWSLLLHLRLPKCALTTGLLGGQLSPDKRFVVIKRGLDEDVSLGVDYTC